MTDERPEQAAVICLDATKKPHMPAMRTRCADCGRQVWLSHHARRKLEEDGIEVIPLCIRCTAAVEDLPDPRFLEGQKEMVARMVGRPESDVQEAADFLTLMLRNGVIEDP